MDQTRWHKFGHFISNYTDVDTTWIKEIDDQLLQLQSNIQSKRPVAQEPVNCQWADWHDWEARRLSRPCGAYWKFKRWLNILLEDEQIPVTQRFKWLKTTWLKCPRLNQQNSAWFWNRKHHDISETYHLAMAHDISNTSLNAMTKWGPFARAPLRLAPGVATPASHDAAERSPTQLRVFSEIFLLLFINNMTFFKIDVTKFMKDWRLVFDGFWVYRVCWWVFGGRPLRENGWFLCASNVWCHTGILCSEEVWPKRLFADGWIPTGQFFFLFFCLIHSALTISGYHILWLNKTASASSSSNSWNALSNSTKKYVSNC